MQLDEPPSKLAGRRVREPQKRRMRDLIELVADRGVDRRVTMPMNVTPERTDPIKIAITFDVEEITPLRPIDDKRLAREPVRQRCEGMPDVVVVPFAESFGVVGGQRAPRYRVFRSRTVTPDRPKMPGGVAIDDGDFDPAASTHERHERPWGAIAVGAREALDALAGDLHNPPAGKGGETVGGDVCDQVAECVAEHHLAKETEVIGNGSEVGKGDAGGKRRAELGGVDPLHQVGGRWCEDVAAVERGRNIRAPQAGFVSSQTPSGGPLRSTPLIKPLSGKTNHCFATDTAISLRTVPHTRIDHDEVDRPARETRRRYQPSTNAPSSTF